MASEAPRVHSVHIYDEDSALITRLCGIVASSLRVGNAVVIVATTPHRDDLVKDLTAVGIDVRSHARDGRFTMLDARELLSTFMVNTLPDRERFLTSIGTLLEDARRKACSPGRGLTVFGEMVSVLWDEGNKSGAMQLEYLWNDALQERAFHLHCAYPRAGFASGEQASICSAHSHVLQ